MEEIDEVRDWAIVNMGTIIDVFRIQCESGKYDCDLNEDDIAEVERRMYRDVYRTQVFCPTINSDMDFDTFGVTHRNAAEEIPGQMALYPFAFDKGACQIAETYVHELVHVGELGEHDLTNPDYQNDWIYMIGTITKMGWKSDGGKCK